MENNLAYLNSYSLEKNVCRNELNLIIYYQLIIYNEQHR